MTLPIQLLRVSNFRGFKDLAVGPFGRVNLITGKNNSGKSSLLEAIRVFATDGSMSTFDSIVSFREEADSGLPTESDLELPWEGPFPYSSLFSGFPDLLQSFAPFTISNEGEGISPSSLQVRVGWFVREGDPAGITLRPADPSTDASAFPVLEVVSSRRDRDRRARIYRRIRNRPDRNDPGYASCIYLDPSSSRSTDQLANLWDSIALTAEERQVVTALQILAPDIEAVSVIGSDSRSRQRTAIAKSRKYPRPVPLRSFGDGVNRLFGIILSLAAAKGGVLAVDEVENGLHFSILPDVWRMIFQMAESLSVQVFATTHSDDCIKAFQVAASGHPAEGVLVRLTDRENEIIPTVFRESELEIATKGSDSHLACMAGGARPPLRAVDHKRCSGPRS